MTEKSRKRVKKKCPILTHSSLLIWKEFQDIPEITVKGRAEAEERG